MCLILMPIALPTSRAGPTGKHTGDRAAMAKSVPRGVMSLRTSCCCVHPPHGRKSPASCIEGAVVGLARLGMEVGCKRVVGSFTLSCIATCVLTESFKQMFQRQCAVSTGEPDDPPAGAADVRERVWAPFDLQGSCKS